MKKLKKVCLLSTTGLLALALASCDQGPKEIEYNYENSNASASVATSGTAESFVESSYEDREEILGLLEKYAIKNNLTGLVLYDDGGYGRYSSRVQFPTKQTGTNAAGTPTYEYVTGYGFGIVSDGSLNGSLSGVNTYQNYYHTYETEDPKTLNYMNDKGSVVGDYVGYVSGGYFDTKLNAEGDGYEWFPSLATEANQVEGFARPLPKSGSTLVANPTLRTMSTDYRIYVRTGIEYNTAGSYAATYAGREVVLDDYITPFKQLFNQSNGLARGAENLTGAASIKGMNAYYNATSSGYDATAWNNVGIKTGTDSTGSYIDFTFNTACTPFYASYYLSSSLYSPIPEAFLNEIGGIKMYGSFNANATKTPVDNTLSVGPYVVEAWQNDKEFVFKKNDKANAAVLGGENRYSVAGVHVAVLAAAKTDTLAAWKEYEAGKLDAVGIPKDKLSTEKNGAYTQITKGSSTTKLNVNSCTQEEWEYYFGENGTITQTSKSDYWDVKPAMSNDDFLLGLNLALDRAAYATNHGVTPSLNYFSDNYLIDPENGISYNSTETHKNVMKEFYGDNWDSYNGTTNKDLAIAAFKKATTKLLADGAYKEGDKITIEIVWQAEAQIANNGAEIKTFLEDAFNNAAVCNNKLELEIKNVAVATWSDVYYKKMMVGQFDIGFGGISGNTLNPINFMEVLKSDNSSGFTLNWGTDTNSTANLITYKGKQYTFDALFQAADTGCVVNSNGSLATTYDAELAKNVKNAEGGRDVVIKFATSNIANVVSTSVSSVYVCWYDGEEYEEVEVEYTIVGDEIRLSISKELAEHYQGSVSFDIYFDQKVGTADSTSPLISLDSQFSVWE